MKSLEIKKQEDRLKVAAILIDNGYTVRIGKTQEGGKTKTVLIYENQIKGDKR